MMEIISRYPRKRFNPKTGIIAIDGVPRAEHQLHALRRLFKIEKVFHFAIDDEAIVLRRIRRSSRTRADDLNMRVLRERIKVARRAETTVLSHFPSNKVVKIDSGRSSIPEMVEAVKRNLSRR